MKLPEKLVESVRRTREGKLGTLFLALALSALSPMAIFGQPVDSIVGGFGLVALVVGLVFLLWGGFTFMTTKGKQKLIGGIAGVVIAIVMIGIFGIPTLPSGGFITPDEQPGAWQVCLTNANYATIGLGTCPTSMVGAKAVLKSQTVPTSNFYVYFNITVTPPAGSTQVAFNTIMRVNTPPSLTNTSDPSQTAPVLALLTGGQYDVVITPASGTATNEQQVVPLTPGTAKVVAFRVHFGTIIGQLSLGQYPVGVTVTFSVSDQNSGQVYGSLSLSVTFT